MQRRTLSFTFAGVVLIMGIAYMFGRPAPEASGRAAGAATAPGITPAPTRVPSPTAAPMPLAPQPAPQPAEATPGPGYLVGAYFYPWYGPGSRHWQDGYAGHPALGEYDSSDPAVIAQQIDWAAGSGVDFFAFSWWGPGSPEDRALHDAFLGSPRAAAMRFAILYETTGRLQPSAGGTIDLSAAENRRVLLNDFAYLQATYWNDPRCLKVDGRPVVLLYLARQLTGDVAGALADVRQAARSQGSDVYVIGDEVFWRQWHPLDPGRLKLYDAVTAYNMHASVAGIADGFTGKVQQEYAAWRAQALAAGVAFVPGILPGFDDTHVRPAAGHPPIPRSTALFRQQLAMGLDLAQPPLNMVLITSWNEWHEDTSIEPAAAFGLDYLRTLKEALAGR